MMLTEVVDLLKKISLFVVAFLSVLLLFVVFSVQKSLSNPIARANNYLVYYGKVTPLNVQQITEYDLAILEPTAVENAALEKLQQSNTQLFAYVSAFEVERYNQLLRLLLKDEDYLHLNNEKHYIPKYDCYAGDIRSANYRTALLQIIKERVIDKGYDGVFLDTIDDIEYLSDESAQKELTDGYLNFLEELKNVYPDLLVIQNRAFKLYQAGSAQFVDGLMYEDLRHEKVADSRYYQNIVDSLSTLAQQRRVVIMAISHENPVDNHLLCQDLKWLYFYSPKQHNYMVLESQIYSVIIAQSHWESILSALFEVPGRQR